MKGTRKKTAGSHATEPVADAGNDDLIALLDALPLPASVASESGRLILHANAAWLRLLGYASADDVIGRTVESFIAPESLKKARDALARGRATGEYSRENRRYQLVRCDGTFIDVEIAGAPATLRGTPVIVSLLSDNSEDARTRHALETSERSYRAFIENAVDAMIVHRDERIMYANPAGLKLYAANRAEDVIGRSIWDFIAPESRDEALRRVKAITSTQMTLPRVRVNLIDLEGRRFAAEAHDVQIPYEDGIAVLTTIRDLRPTEEAEAALRESEERYRSVVSVLREGIILQDADGRLLTFNDAAADIFHIGAKDVLGETSISRDWGTIREDGTDLPSEEHPSMVTFRTGRPCDQVLVGVRGPSGVRWIEVNTEPMIRPGETHPYAVVVSCTDVTERKQAVDELKEYKAGLESLVAQRTAEFEEASRAKSQFLASMSHELRTPLNSIIGFTGIMLQGLTGELTSEQRAQLEMVNRAGRQLLGLVSDVLDLERIEAGRVELGIEEVDVAKVVNALADTVRPLATDVGLSLDVCTDGAPACVRTDRRRVEQILLNFLSNAVKYTERGGIEFTASSMADGSVAFTVRDTGIGIAPEDQAIVFDEFRQLPAHRGAKHPGAGLGLSISRQLADLLGGRIEIASAPGEGSTFTLILPAG
ncbi:MAG: PAS domain S-box protein [Coriobacteriia bacterium]|nr:PAS domain S-box protein [Coriobacteriia bacterium]